MVRSRATTAGAKIPPIRSLTTSSAACCASKRRLVPYEVRWTRIRRRRARRHPDSGRRRRRSRRGRGGRGASHPRPRLRPAGLLPDGRRAIPRWLRSSSPSTVSGRPSRPTPPRDAGRADHTAQQINLRFAFACRARLCAYGTPVRVGRETVRPFREAARLAQARPRGYARRSGLDAQGRVHPRPGPPARGMAPSISGDRRGAHRDGHRATHRAPRARPVDRGLVPGALSRAWRHLIRPATSPCARRSTAPLWTRQVAEREGDPAARATRGGSTRISPCTICSPGCVSRSRRSAGGT